MRDAPVRKTRVVAPPPPAAAPARPVAPARAASRKAGAASATVAPGPSPPPAGKPSAPAKAPRKGASPRLDVVLGVVGTILLLVSVALVVVLPHKDVLTPQFNLAVKSTELTQGPRENPDVSYAVRQFYVGNDSADQSFLFDVPSDDITSITVAMDFTDDMGASQPDFFSFEVVAPDGTSVAKSTLSNPPPTVGAANLSGDPGTTVPVTVSPAETQFSFPVGPAPQPAVIDAASPRETPTEAAVRIQEANHRATNGTWTVRVRLLAAGGCTSTAANATDQQAYELQARCRSDQFTTDPGRCGGAGTAASCDGTDHGNQLRIDSFRYTTYAVLTCPVDDPPDCSAP